MTWTLRLFVSSTFADLTEERNALNDDAFPHLQRICASLGGRLHVVDLRWGVSDDVTRDQRTLDVCLEEIARCQQISPWLNFMVLIGDRYGWRPLPATIRASHAKLLRAGLSPADCQLFDNWYQVDKNARPKVYHLLSRTPLEPARTESAWATDAPQLHDALERAGDALGVDERLRYFSSATEQEILRGALSGQAVGSVYCYVREGRPAGAADVRAVYIDGTGGVPDAAATSALEDLKQRLQQAPHVKVRTARTSWRHGRPAGSPRPWLSSLVVADLASEIERHAEQAKAIDPAAEESAQHRSAAAERRHGFTGREHEVQLALEKMSSSVGSPVVVTGPPGSGKSALLSELATRFAGSQPGSVVVVRLIGVTSESSDERALVAGLCRELDRSNGRAGTPLPPDLQGLGHALQGRLREVTAGPMLALVLDGIDQLAGTARPLAWLPAVLPARVAVVLSTSSPEWLGEQQRRFGTIEQIELTAMADGEASELLRRWLHRDKRSLTDDQHRAVLAGFSAGRLPLQLWLAFEQARRWPSYLSPTPVLSDDPVQLVEERLKTLATDHGPTLVGHTMAYLRAARQGLAEDELIDVLSRDRAVISELRRRSPLSPRTTGFPPVVWYRLAGDLRPYIVERAAEGGPLLGFYHHLVETAAAAQSPALLRTSHRALARYFTESASAGFDPGRPRPLVELPYQLAGARQLEELLAVVTDVRFLEAKAQLGKTASTGAAGDRDLHLGVYQLLDDLDMTIAAVMQQTDSSDRQGTSRLTTLRVLVTAIRAEAGTIARNPWLTRQQLVNRLQWSAPALAAGFTSAAVSYPRTWLRMLIPGSGSPALIWTLDGHDRLGGCALSSDARLVVGGVHDRSLTVWDCRSGLELAELVGHQGRVLTFALTADGRQLASAGADGTLRIWDPMSGAALAVLTIDAGETTTSALGAADTLLLTGHRSGALCTWRIGVAEPGEVFKHNATPVRTCALSPDGLVGLAGRVDGTVDIIDLRTGEVTPTQAGHDGAVRACLLSPDGRIAVTGGEDGYLRWHDRQGRLLAEQHDQPGAVSTLAASATWTIVASAGFDGSLRLYDTTTRKLRCDPGERGLSSINACTIGDRLAVAAHAVEGTISVWEVSSGRLLTEFRGHTGDATGCVLDPAEHVAASSGLDGTVRLWDLTQLADVPHEGHRTTVTDCAVSTDELWGMTTSTDGTACIWDTTTGSKLAQLDDHYSEVLGCAIDPNRIYLATTGTDGSLHLYRDRGATHVRSFEMGPGGTACTFNANGSWVAAACDDGTIHAWSVPDGKELPVLTGHQGLLTRILPTATPGQLVSAGVDGTVRLWDARTGSCLHLLGDHRAQVNDCAVAGDGTIVSAGSDGQILLWDTGNGTHAHRLVKDDSRWLRCSISTDGQQIVGTNDRGEARVWSRSGGAGGRLVAQHRAAVRACSLSADGTLLAVGGDDDEVRLLEAHSGTELGLLPTQGRPTAMALLPTSRAVLCGDDGGEVTIARLDRFGQA